MARGRLIPPPSYHQGFARSAGESAYPDLWRGLVGAWVPWLGLARSDSLVDVSGYGQDGTFSNLDINDWVIKEHGPVLGWDGSTSDHSVNISDTSRLDITGTTMSIVMWVRPTFTTDVRWMIDKSATNTAGYRWFMSASVPTFRFRVFDSVGATNCDLSEGFTQNEWVHVAAVADGTDLIIYKEGRNRAATGFTGNITSSATTLAIGRQDDDITNSWEGQIGEVRIYDRALSAGEIYADSRDRLGTFRLRRRILAKAPAVVAAGFHPTLALTGVGF